MTTLETWNRLAQPEQLARWRSFVEALDTGDAGYHPDCAVLMPLWDRGDVPEAIEMQQLAARDAEMAEDDRWAAQHLAAFTPAERYRDYGAPPF